MMQAMTSKGAAGEGDSSAVTRGAVANLIRLADSDDSGTIDYTEFERVALAADAWTQGGHEMK